LACDCDVDVNDDSDSMVQYNVSNSLAHNPCITLT